MVGGRVDKGLNLETSVATDSEWTGFERALAAITSFHPSIWLVYII